MKDKITYPILETAKANTLCTEEQYHKLYEQSVSNPEEFWREQKDQIDWFKVPTKIKNTDFSGDVSIKWFEDGVLNACYNCIDRHLPDKADDIALIWEGDDPENSFRVTYGESHKQICRFANVLKELGVRKGDRVILYMPMTVEAVYAMLACARIGAVHSVVFGGFSPKSLAERLHDCGSDFVITADEGRRGGRTVPLKNNVDEAIKILGDSHGDKVQTVLMVQCTGSKVPMTEGRDIRYNDISGTVTDDCPAEPMNAEDPLFILYTSGSTGKPKGISHTTGGYLLWACITYRYVFDYKPGEIFWCTADVGWITGHSYLVYGPLANGATTLVFEGVPTYPDASRCWQVVDKHKVNIFYTAPTAIRALMREGDAFVTKTDRSSLRLLGTVGEPINPEAWVWYYKVVGKERCPIVDTWWQTETGGILLSPLPGATALKPGSATRPLFGIQPAIVDAQGNILEGPAEGNLVMLDSWPGQMRTIYGDHQRLITTYFSMYENMYMTGDGCCRDEDGYYWITGRVDDVINVSGHRIGTAEIESVLVSHGSVSEAAVVDFKHKIKGQGIYAYVICKVGEQPDDDMRAELIKLVRQEIGPFAAPERIHFTPGLPKTRSGKIMRRILRKIATNDYEDLGDTSTLADPSIVDDLIETRVSG